MGRQNAFFLQPHASHFVSDVSELIHLMMSIQKPPFIQWRIPLLICFRTPARNWVTA